MILLFACWLSGVIFLFGGFMGSLAQGDKEFILRYMRPLKPKNNIMLLIVAVLLISVWPVFILKPIYNWMKAPC